MKSVKGCRRCIWIGLLFSVFIHTTIAAALLWVESPASTSPVDRELSLDLAMFSDGEDSDSIAQSADHPTMEETRAPPETTLVEPVQTPIQEQVLTSKSEAIDSTMPEPEPEPEPEITPEPNPLIPAQPQSLASPIAQPVKVGKTAKLEPKPQAPAPPQTSATLKPAPVLKPKPKPKPKPKSQPALMPPMAAKTPAMTTADPRPNLSQDKRLNSGLTSGTEGLAKRSEQGRSGSAPAKAKSERDYLIALQQAIARHQKYPMEAQRREQTGITTVSFVVEADGRIDQIRIVKGSGQPALDRAALDALRRLGRFKPIPLSIGRQSWPLRVPIRFDLK